MRIVFVSYVYKSDFHDPEAWLSRIDFFTGVLEQVATHADVIAVYNFAFKGKLERNGVTYIFPAFESMRWPTAFNRYILSLKPDTVVIQGFSPVQIYLLTRRNKSIRIFVQHRAEKPYSGLKKIVQRYVDRFITGYFFSSKELAHNWVRTGQIATENKISEMIGMSSIFKMRERGIDTSAVFLWVGDLDQNKNPQLAVNAFRSFHKKHPTAKLFLIYRPNELEADMKRSADDSVVFVGSVPHKDMGEWFHRADFILSTSYYESAGMSVCEGMSCGCIPVATDIPSFRAMTEGGAAGILYPAGDESALIKALEHAITIDIPAMRKKVVESFQRRLSFEANARVMIDALTRP